jgi:DNA replication and repair protein RecF
VTALAVSSFRNLQQTELTPVGGVNVICGENGQGKTNLIEAIWLFTGARSFRGAREAEFVPLGGEQSLIDLGFSAFSREQEMRLLYGKRKAAFLNGVESSSVSSLAGNFTAVVFSPTHLSLVKGGPSERRRALDTMIAQMKPRYSRVLAEYQRQLLQRNTLLKDSLIAPQLLDTLDVWDQSLAKTGTLIARTRQSCLARLAPLAAQIYDGIAGGRESLAMQYEATGAASGELSEDAMLTLLRQSRAEDRKTGTTAIGPHRDDFSIKLSGLSARTFGSQGQQRSAVLALKLGECALIEQVTGEAPVVLLDDVMSELDERRRDYLLHHLEERQIFLTCCDPRQVEGAQAVYEVEKGMVKSINIR